MIKLLLSKNANINAKDLNGRSPLFLATKLNKVNAVRVLLANMSNAFVMDKNGNKIEELTENGQIQKLIARGKSF